MAITYLGGSRITGVSGDTKPTNVEVGSLFVETNTQKTYILYDGAGTTMPSAATGGTITTDGDYKVHTFSSDGTFTVTARLSREPMEFLVIASGAGGGTRRDLAGRYQEGCGAGAGGYREVSKLTFPTGVTIDGAADSFHVDIAQGGSSGQMGQNTYFGFSDADPPVPTENAIMASSGGYVSFFAATWGMRGGGSGGGQWFGKGNAGNFLPPEGYSGGSGSNSGSGNSPSKIMNSQWWVAGYGAGGGAGGASEHGMMGSGNKGGKGGTGRASAITGTRLWYAGGGGGHEHSANGTQSTDKGIGGRGGGGDSDQDASRDSSQVTDANAGYGSGGGGKGGSSGGTTDGYDGVVIIRYKFQNFLKWKEINFDRVNSYTHYYGSLGVSGGKVGNVNQLDGVYY